VDQLFSSELYRDQTVLITGGGTGIGLHVAREVGRLGARVAICGRRSEPLQAAVESLSSEGVEATFQTCDIRASETIEALVDHTLERFGSIDLLVNNAGGQFPSPAEHISANGFEAVVRNNLLGTWNMTRTVANRAMIPAKSGRIVNVIAQIRRGFPGMAHTGAARAGVENLTRTLAVEWSKHGIRVNAVAPGVIKTSGTRQYPPELLETARLASPVKRLGHPAEVSHLITYLGCRYADFITGQTFTIDGGQSLWGDPWPVADDVPQSPPYSDES
jgi:citronellol/citronellal dehydrogenase